MATPEHIKKIIEDYKRPGENVIIMPEVIKCQDKIYYSASYHRSREASGYLFLREDGSIPPKQEIIEVLFIALSISAIYSVFFRSTRRLMKRRFIFVRWAYKVLKKLEQKYANEVDGLRYIKSYLKTTESTLINHQKFKEKALEQKKLLFKIMDKGIVTSESYYKSQEIHLEMGRCLFFINYDQMKSYQDRRRVIKFLLKKGDIFNALGLLFVHLQLHPPYVKSNDQKTFHFTKTRYVYHKVPKQEVTEFADSISVIRNPSSSKVEEHPRELALDFYQQLGEPIEGV